MPDNDGTRVLVVGASGQLGGAIARKLLAAGTAVRALGRNRGRLEPLAAAGAGIAAVDLLDLTKLTEACRGIGQIIATANNNMGFNEVAARLISLGYYAATLARPFPEWKASADRFGVTPRTVEEYVNALR